MAINVRPSIVTSGLVLNLDAANMKSYPRSGTTWRDLSGLGNNGTLTNGPSYNSQNGGSIVFDGTDDFVETTATNLNSNIGTLNLWIKTGFSSSDTRPGYFIDTRDSTNIQNISIYYFLAQGGFIIYGNSSIIFTVSKTFSINTYFMLTLTYNFNSDSYAFYINGVLENSSTSLKSSSNNITKTTLGSRFNQAGGEYFIGNIYATQIYNRALTPTEVQQNYNATKTRFGLQ
jgi:hypothetical protein